MGTEWDCGWFILSHFIFILSLYYQHLQLIHNKKTNDIKNMKSWWSFCKKRQPSISVKPSDFCLPSLSSNPTTFGHKTPRQVHHSSYPQQLWSPSLQKWQCLEGKSGHLSRGIKLSWVWTAPSCSFVPSLGALSQPWRLPICVTPAFSRIFLSLSN